MNISSNYLSHFFPLRYEIRASKNDKKTEMALQRHIHLGIVAPSEPGDGHFSPDRISFLRIIFDPISKGDKEKVVSSSLPLRTQIISAQIAEKDRDLNSIALKTNLADLTDSMEAEILLNWKQFYEYNSSTKFAEFAVTAKEIRLQLMMLDVKLYCWFSLELF